MQLHIVVSLKGGYSKVLQVSDSAPCYYVTSFAKLNSITLHREDVGCCILEFSLSKWQTEEFPKNLAHTFTNLHCLPQGLMDHLGKRWTMMWLEVLLTGNPSTTVLQPFLIFEICHPGEIYHEGVSLYHFCSSRRILTSLLNVCLFIHIRSMIVLGLSIK
jgi:hypothetical protein